MDKNGYPTEKEIKTIKSWDIIKKGPEDLIGFIEEIWKYADCGYFQLRGKRVLRLELHTAGWSGNEEIIEALQDNQIFWMLYWMKSVRGGHFYFRIDLRKTGKRKPKRRK